MCGGCGAVTMAKPATTRGRVIDHIARLGVSNVRSRHALAVELGVSPHTVNAAFQRILAGDVAAPSPRVLIGKRVCPNCARKHRVYKPRDRMRLRTPRGMRAPSLGSDLRLLRKIRRAHTTNTNIGTPAVSNVDAAPDPWSKYRYDESLPVAGASVMFDRNDDATSTLPDTNEDDVDVDVTECCLLYTSPSPRDS